MGDSSAEQAAEELAWRLYLEIETHYPGAFLNPPDWEGLSEQDRNYFRDCVSLFLEQKDLVMAALGISSTEPTTTAREHRS